MEWHGCPLPETFPFLPLRLIETVEEFGKRGIGLRSLTEAIGTTTSGGKLVFHIFAALAEFERGVIRERTLAGLQAARARGRLGGRPPALRAKDLAAAKAMLRDPELTVTEIDMRFEVRGAFTNRLPYRLVWQSAFGSAEPSAFGLAPSNSAILSG